MFSEVTPFEVTWPMRGSCVFKCLKSYMPTREWHLKRDPGELPSCAGAQRSALLCERVLRSSVLKIYAMSIKDAENC